MGIQTKLEEGIHYYMEGDRVVFTALSLVMQGKCYGSGCKNCPYSPKHIKGNLVLVEEFIKFKS